MGLRDYQAQGCDAISMGLIMGANPLVQVATGGGKSWMVAETARRLVEADPGKRVLVLAHVKELIAQNANALAGLGVPAGVYCAGLNRRELFRPVTVATIQSLAAYLKRLPGGPETAIAKARGRAEPAARRCVWDAILIDEAHRVSHKQAGLYNWLFGLFPDAPRVGYTATPYRLDGGPIWGDDGVRWFSERVFVRGMADLTAAGHLTPLVARGAPRSGLMNLKGVRTRAGEFDPEQHTAAAMRVLPETVAAILQHGTGRRAWLIFAASVEHGKALTEALHYSGVSVGWLDGTTDDVERGAMIARLRSGEARARPRRDPCASPPAPFSGPARGGSRARPCG